jgi:hypothetical protein
LLWHLEASSHKRKFDFTFSIACSDICEVVSPFVEACFIIAGSKRFMIYSESRERARCLHPLEESSMSVKINKVNLFEDELSLHASVFMQIADQ